MRAAPGCGSVGTRMPCVHRFVLRADSFLESAVVKTRGTRRRMQPIGLRDANGFLPQLHGDALDSRPPASAIPATARRARSMHATPLLPSASPPRRRLRVRFTSITHACWKDTTKEVGEACECEARLVTAAKTRGRSVRRGTWRFSYCPALTLPNRRSHQRRFQLSRPGALRFGPLKL
jgi:hypothetical protein